MLPLRRSSGGLCVSRVAREVNIPGKPRDRRRPRWATGRQARSRTDRDGFPDFLPDRFPLPARRRPTLGLFFPGPRGKAGAARPSREIGFVRPAPGSRDDLGFIFAGRAAEELGPPAWSPSSIGWVRFSRPPLAGAIGLARTMLGSFRHGRRDHPDARPRKIRKMEGGWSLRGPHQDCGCWASPRPAHPTSPGRGQRPERLPVGGVGRDRTGSAGGGR